MKLTTKTQEPALNTQNIIVLQEKRPVFNGAKVRFVVNCFENINKNRNFGHLFYEFQLDLIHIKSKQQQNNHVSYINSLK